MCGIAAIVAAPGSPDLAAIRAMTDQVRHRGPDDEGYVFLANDDLTPAIAGGDDTPSECYRAALPYSPQHPIAAAPTGCRVALGHRRLAIVDLSARGHQPMCRPGRSLWIVYNGEIYNHRELRQELTGLGVEFGSASDTEVVLAAYELWGEDCLPRLDGMFAFAIVDRRRRRLFAARDRFGIKPLYVWRSPAQTTALASEIKQFTALPGWRAQRNPQRCYDFLRHGLLDHTAETMFSGVSQLRAGEALSLDLSIDRTSTLEPRRWYTLRGRPHTGGLDDAARELGELVADSVSRHLVADVAVGSCLSGGLDSSAIVCVMSRQRTAARAGAVETFTAGSEHPRFDERAFADQVVRHTGARSHRVMPRFEHLVGALDHMTWHQDEPFGSTSILAQWEVFRTARAAGVPVLLDGQGADELFAGYDAYLACRLRSLVRARQWTALWRELYAAAGSRRFGTRWLVPRIAASVAPRGVSAAIRRARRPRWLDADALGAVARDPDGIADPRSIDELSRAQLSATSLPMLLHWEDRDSMAHSIESRLPWLDHRIVEFALGLPDDCKLAEGVSKRVVREAMRGTLPEPVRTRVDKLGFATAEEIWVRREHTAWFRGELASAVERSGGALTRDALTGFDRVVTGRQSFGFQFWRMISFSRWLQRFGVS